MILHPVISDIAKRRESLQEAIRKGHLSPELSKYTQPGWAYIYKGDDSPALGFAQIGNRLDGMSAPDDRGLAYVTSTDDEDRDGDIVKPMGIQLKNYSRNPVVFFGHQEMIIPIGVCRSPDDRITVFPEENRVTAVIYFDKDPDSDLIFQKCLNRTLNATSIAFVPIEAWKRDDIQKARQQNSSPPGWYFNQWDKTEVSIVGVPSNPNAVGLAKDLQGACRDVWDKERGHMSPKLQKAWLPYCAVEKGCWNGWCPVPIIGESEQQETKAMAPEAELIVCTKCQGYGYFRKLGKEKALDCKDCSGTGLVEKKACGCDDCSKGKACGCSGKKKAYRIEQDSKSGYVLLTTVENYNQAMNAARTIPGSRVVDETGKVIYSGPGPTPKKDATQADSEGSGIPGRNANPPGDAKQKASQSLVIEFKDKNAAGDAWRVLTRLPRPDPKEGLANAVGFIGGHLQTDEANLIQVSGPSDWLNTVLSEAQKIGGKRSNRRLTKSKNAPVKKLFEEGDALSLTRPVQTSSGIKGVDSTAIVQAIQGGNQLLVKFIDGSTAVIPDTYGIVSGKKSVKKEPNKADTNYFKQGADAAKAGKLRGANPYPYSTYPFIQWNSGWDSIMNKKPLLGDPGSSSSKPRYLGDDDKSKALGESSGMMGGYAVAPKPIQANDATRTSLDETRTEGWATCDSCHGDGNCLECGGTGDVLGSARTIDGSKECPKCGGSGECQECDGQGHVQKSVKKGWHITYGVRRTGDGFTIFGINGDGTTFETGRRFANNSEAERAASEATRRASGGTTIDPSNRKPNPGPVTCPKCGKTYTSNFPKDVQQCPQCKNVFRVKSVAKGQDPQLAPQAQNIAKQQPTVPQILAALYSHAKAEAAYIDQLDDQFKDNLADYRGQHLDERMDYLKGAFSKAATDEDLDKMVKAFENGYDTQTDRQVTAPPDSGQAKSVKKASNNIYVDPKKVSAFRTDANALGVKITWTGDRGRGTASQQVWRAEGDEDDLQYLAQRYMSKTFTQDASSEGVDGLTSTGESQLVNQGDTTDEDKAVSGKSMGSGWDTYDAGGGNWFAISGDGTQKRGPFRTEAEALRVAKGTKTMKENVVPADGGYMEGDSDAAGELNAGATPYNKSADRDTVSEGDAPFNKDFPEDLDTDPAKDATGTGDSVDEGATVYNKDGTGTGDDVDGGPTVYNKDIGGPCQCGADAPPGASFCPGCGSPMDQGKADVPPDDPGAIPPDPNDGVVQAGMDDLVPGGDMKATDDIPPPDAVPGDSVAMGDGDGGTDPNVDEILERYRNPKSLQWMERKWILPKVFVAKHVHFRVAKNGKKYLVKAVGDPDDLNKDAATPSDGTQVIGSGAVKQITNRLAKAIDDIKALFNGPDLPKHYKPALKHIADSIWYVGKELTDAGKLQRNSGGGGATGSVLSDKGKVQRNGGSGTALGGGGNGSLDSNGAQQGKSPAKSWIDAPADPTVVARLANFEKFCRNQGILGGDGDRVTKSGVAGYFGSNSEERR